MTITRRNVLIGAAAVAASAAIPSVPATPAVIGLDLASGPDKSVWWVAGTPGERDAIAVRALNPKEALDEWHYSHHGTLQCEAVAEGEAETPPDDCECEFCASAPEASRVKHFDTLDREPTPADWMHAGFDVTCQKCGYECSSDCGGVTDDGLAYCEGCFDEYRRDKRLAATAPFDRLLASLEAATAFRDANAHGAVATVAANL